MTSKFIYALVNILDAGKFGGWIIVDKQFKVFDKRNFFDSINEIRNSVADYDSTSRYSREFFYVSDIKNIFNFNEHALELIKNYRLQVTMGEPNLILNNSSPLAPNSPQYPHNEQCNIVDIPNERIELLDPSANTSILCSNTEAIEILEMTCCNELHKQIVTCTKECLISLIKEIYPILIVQRKALANSKSFIIPFDVNSDLLEFCSDSKILYNKDTSFTLLNKVEYPIAFTLYQCYTNYFTKILDGMLINNQHHEIQFCVEKKDIIYYDNKCFIQFCLFCTSAISKGIVYIVKTIDVEL